MRRILYLPIFAALLMGGEAYAADAFVVQTTQVRDEKAVFATVESQNIIPARVRTGGTIVSLSVHEGDVVRQGQVIAILTDHKLAQQIAALDASINGLKAQQAQAQAELTRNAPLFDNGVISKTAMDQFRTAVSVTSAGVKARTAERAAVEEQITQGQVLAPAAGRVLTVPVAVGAVMMGGEAVATVASQDRVVRLQIPESNATSLNVGDIIQIDGDGVPSNGAVTLIYPHVSQGMVQADIKIAASDAYFVGQRVRAWVPMKSRPALVVPVSYLTVRFGMDFARVHGDNGLDMDVPVQRGQAASLPNGDEGVEVLTGLKPGDQLVQP